MLTCVKQLFAPYQSPYICIVNALKFKRIIYLISATVIITVGIQVYRNVQNYQLNKERFVTDVQRALDLSVEAYYANQVKTEVLVFDSFNDLNGLKITNEAEPNTTLIGLDSAWLHSFSTDGQFKGPTIRRSSRDSSGFSISVKSSTGFSAFDRVDSLLSQSHTYLDSVRVKREPWVSGSMEDFKGFTNRVFFALTKELDFVKMDSFLIEELDRKNIKVDHALWHYVRDTIRKSNDDEYALMTVSKSTYLPDNQELHMKFNNASMILLKRGALDLLISLLISCAVIGSLMYLYRIITQQKELAEIKNDLISNITHEFKTPIATVSTAIEAISNFNQTNDKEKTAKYLDISSNQLQKLNGMVEKLLETASLDTDELDLNLETVELVKFTQQIFERFHVIKGDKKLVFQTETSERFANIDLFHMENAVANLVDNAIKYGGDEIVIKLSEEGDKTFWHVVDNGRNLGKQQQERIFDQFYRVPTGNVHDVKGFGIGLYYTKKIVEKHEGEISVSVSASDTKFTIAI